MRPTICRLKVNRRALLAALGAISILSAPPLALSTLAEAPSTVDALPSWNDGAAKQAIVDFVKATTDKSSSNFVPPEERIATFDQDGTLWVEHPMYSQVVYSLDRVPARSQSEAGTGQCRAVQDSALRRSRGNGKANNA